MTPEVSLSWPAHLYQYTRTPVLDSDPAATQSDTQCAPLHGCLKALGTLVHLLQTTTVLCGRPVFNPFVSVQTLR